MTPLLATLALCPVAGDHDWMRPMAVSHSVRLAITPVLDGKIDDEEWDKLADADGSPTYFQWEPDTLFWAARAKSGQDVVFSLDTKADGWLVGNDNLEFRVSHTGGAPTVSVRRLDVTDPSGPQWVPPGVLTESVKMAAVSDADGWTLEVAYTPKSTEAPVTGTKIGARVDLVPSGLDLGEPYVPRAMSFMNLQFDTGMNLPSGFSWRPDFLVRVVPVDDAFKAKYGFKRTENVEFNQVEYRGEGLARELMAAGTRPFPEWNKKNQASEHYATILAKNAPTGYRVLRLELKGADGQPTVLRSSFRIADLVDFNVNLPKSLPLNPDARIVRGSIDVRSNGLQRVNGLFRLSVPADWTATRGKETKFVIYHSRGTAKVPVEIIVPRDTVGVFPLTFTAVIGEKEVSKTVYIPVGQS